VYWAVQMTFAEGMVTDAPAALAPMLLSQFHPVKVWFAGGVKPVPASKVGVSDGFKPVTVEGTGPDPAPAS
jgi:hypothetical protein